MLLDYKEKTNSIYQEITEAWQARTANASF
jgi:hypothetical protein